MMTALFIIACVAIGLFIAYNVISISLLGIPYSLSGTYYLFNERKPGSGIWFSVMMISVFLLLMVPWMYLSTIISDWSSYLTVLPFISCACMCYVGLAPNIRDSKHVEKIHIIFAAVGATRALLWVLVVCWKISYIFPIWILLCGGIAHLTKTAKKARDYWLEISAFGTVFTTIICEFLLH